MKNLSFLSIALLTFCVLFFSACKKEDELSTRDELIGKWNYEFVSYEEYRNDQLIDSGSDSIVGVIIEFKDNETFVVTTTDEEGFIDTDNGTWGLEGKTLTFGGSIDTFGELEIKEITGKKMVLVYEEETTTQRYKEEITLKK